MLKKMISFVAVAGLVFALAPAAQAAIIDLNNPGDVALYGALLVGLGLGDGDTFHLVFVTSRTISSSSTSIGVYNTFVNNVANNQGYTGSIVDYGWTWKAIGSTAADAAITNTGTTWDEANRGYPIYLVGGDENPVAADYKDLWDGSILRPINHAEDGVSSSGWHPHTGTDANGYTLVTHELGAVSGWVERGVADAITEDWIHDTNWQFFHGDHMYAISPPVSVIPEPTVLALLGLGGLGMLLRRRSRKA